VLLFSSLIVSDVSVRLDIIRTLNEVAICLLRKFERSKHSKLLNVQKYEKGQMPFVMLK